MGFYKSVDWQSISIHAPTWGATSLILFALVVLIISIHAPTWGATFKIPRSHVRRVLFQSTHPHGVRRNAIKYLWRWQHISIHAPTWGATKFSWSQSRCDQFQSTHPHGVRPVTTSSPDPDVAKFQSTHPHGVRLPALDYLSTSLSISIHAPTWGATVLTRLFHSVKIISIHAPTWGATAFACAGDLAERYFNPRTHMGCDGTPKGLFNQLNTISIHAPTWGATRTYSANTAWQRISIHAPTWGATAN